MSAANSSDNSTDPVASFVVKARALLGGNVASQGSPSCLIMRLMPAIYPSDSYVQGRARRRLMRTACCFFSGKSYSRFAALIWEIIYGVSSISRTEQSASYHLASPSALISSFIGEWWFAVWKKIVTYFSTVLLIGSVKPNKLKKFA